MRIAWSGIAAGCLLLAACGSFPSKQLTFDFTEEKVPVMLTPVPGGETTKTLHFESGKVATSVTTSSSRNGVSTTSTAFAATDINVPLHEQMENTLILQPLWIEVSGLSLQTEVSELMVVGSISNRKYRIVLDARIPFQAKE